MGKNDLVVDHGLEALRKSAREVVDGDKSAYFLLVELLSSVEGSFAPSGLTTDFKVTTQDVSDSAAKIPTTPLTDRNTLTVYNTSTSVTVYISKDSGVTANSVVGTTSGYPIFPQSFFNIDIKNAIELYAITPTATSARLTILEVS